MQNEQVLTRYFKDGKIQMIDKDVWDSWTFGNSEQKVANGLTTVEVPEELLDKPIKFNTQTMQWEDASEDEINRVKMQFKKFKEDANKASEKTKQQMQQAIDGLSTENKGLKEQVEYLQQAMIEVAQGGQNNG